jgi:hypothetical protein
MPGPAELLAQLRGPTVLSALMLIVMVAIVIKIGRILLMAAIFGAIAGGASLSQGNLPKTATVHGALAFGAAALMFFLLKVAKSMVMWLVITAAGVAALLAFGFRP